MAQPIYDHDHLSYEEVQSNQAVYQISRYTPPNDGTQEPLDVLLARSAKVAEGMRGVIDVLRGENLPSE